MWDDEVDGDGLMEGEGDQLRCFACLKTDTKRNLPISHQGNLFHQPCWHGVRSHNRQLVSFPKARAVVDDEYENDPAAWHKRIQPFLVEGPERKAALTECKKSYREIEEHSEIVAEKEVEDTLKLTETEYMAFEGFWHLKSREESKHEFAILHATQKGAADRRDSTGKVIDARVYHQGISKSRKESGSESRVGSRKEVDMDPRDGEARIKRLRMTTKTSQHSASYASDNHIDNHIDTPRKDARDNQIDNRIDMSAIDEFPGGTATPTKPPSAAVSGAWTSRA